MGRYPEAASDDLLAGPCRNFQVFDPLDFLAELTQHIPDQGEHLISRLPAPGQAGVAAPSGRIPVPLGLNGALCPDTLLPG